MCAWAFASAPPPQDVLILYSFNQNLPAQGRISAGLGRAMAARGLAFGTFHPEYLDINPPRTPGQRGHLRALLLDKYAGMRFGLIITVFDPARDFLEHEARDLSPGTPVVALFGKDGAQVEGRTTFPLPLRFEVRGTFERALALFPRTRRVLFVSGNAETNLRVEDQARRELAPWADRIAFEFTSGRSVPSVLEEARHLAPDTLILFSIVTSDITGQRFVPTDVVRALAKEANAPVFSILSSFLGEGVVGGEMADPETAGALLGQGVVEVQQGRAFPRTLPGAYVRPMYDWNQLQRWHCDVSLLPEDAIFINRPPSLWGLFRRYVIAAGAVFAALCGLILALLRVNRRRARAELALGKSERLMREAQEAAQVGTYDYDPATGEVRTSSTFARILGLEEEGGAGFETWVERVVPSHRDEVGAGLRNTLATCEPFDREFPIQRPDGELRWLHCRARAEGGPGRRATRLLGTLLDITEHRQMQEELEHTQRLESLGSLASGVAHDMNNVLASIQAVAQTLLFVHGKDAALAGPLGTIDRASDRGRGLVQALTNFSRKGLREARVLDLNELVGEQTVMLRRTLFQKVQVLEDLDPALPPVKGESSTLGSAILNLCVNACDAMPGGGTLTLVTRRAPDGGAQLEVVDSGQGMPPDVVRRAMEPFFTTKPFGKGTGLGLAMVFNTVKAHGGTVQISSRVGAGTTILIHLPAAPGEASGAEPEAEVACRPLRILLVDDDPLIRDSVPGMLTQLGHTVEVSGGGAQALVRFAGGLEVDLVLLDLNMPVMGGAETLANIRALRPTLPAILATGFLDEATAAALAGLERVSVLPKPYTMSQFQALARDL
ncbi:ATP-binding protein [Mesoterricola silvestris]|uniref:ATP-binding protein n=1 Tax=Mesoterricola silvestris TaxID=2927979 RepID=UPI00292FD5B3|nr:ATP-binding protein [Mesoterricola silvestris]